MKFQYFKTVLPLKGLSDAISLKRKKRKTNQRQKNERNRCLQYWTNKWVETSLASTAHIATHNRICAYLQIEKDVILDSFNTMN